MNTMDTRSINTYLPLTTRIFAILQLCAAFTLLAWAVIQPYLSEYVDHQSKLLLYKTLIGDEDLLVKMAPEEASEKVHYLQRNHQRFQQLSHKTKATIYEGLHKLQSTHQYSWGERFQQMWWGMRSLHPLATAWCFFSLMIAFMLLLRIEGAQAAAWILPFLTLAYCISNQIYSQPQRQPADASLFPTEKVLIEEILGEERASSITDQQEQLIRGWERFLLTQYGTNREEAEYQFNLKRIELLKKAPAAIPQVETRQNPIKLLLFLVWNTLFAFFVNRRQALDLHP